MNNLIIKLGFLIFTAYFGFTKLDLHFINFHYNQNFKN